eukprot:TRINITY_DN34210_c0_g1_i1.p1 TRINITY_DN34210_c0_g1~~TRINITY_DN34210_c0_g1_i1.p1  ORF type:complete len:737 (-),score=177.86 TRINITY_DN34210_c0_g1_i1:162-2372(-)
MATLVASIGYGTAAWGPPSPSYPSAPSRSSRRRDAALHLSGCVEVGSMAKQELACCLAAAALAARLARLRGRHRGGTWHGGRLCQVAMHAAPAGTANKAGVMPREKVIGIDLGTTNSAVAAMEAGNATVIPNAEGSRTTPSVVAFTKSGQLLVGEMAKRQAAVNPANTFYSVKRFLGRKAEEAEADAREVAYRVTPADGDSVGLQLECPQLEKQLAPEEVSAQVLRKLASDAGKYLQAKIEKAVVTVPAYFNDSQRQATKDAGTIAGLQVLRIVNEPTAASLAYGLEKRNNETILVFDLGGGTFDVSVLVVGGGVCEVLSTSGDTRLGGDNFDRCVVDWLALEFASKNGGLDLREEPQSLQRLVEAAEKAKIELSGVQETTISLPFITVDSSLGTPLHIEERLSRARFEELCAPLLDRLRDPVTQALEDADLTPADLDEVVLVGGSTRINAVQALVKQMAGNKVPNQSVNPDEVVALGAAVQAGVLAGEVKDLVLLDVIPLSLSVATHDGLSSIFLPRNTRVPAKKTKLFSTAKDNQPRVTVSVVQGERKFAKDNKLLGVFLLDGIPPSPSGIPQIEVTFDVDSNGILNVSALDLATRNEKKVTVSGTSTLAPDDVLEKVEAARKAAEEERYYEEVIMVKNDAESAAYALERMIRDRRKQIKSQKLELLESKLLVIRDELEKSTVDTELLQTVTKDLQEEIKLIIGKKAREEYDKTEGWKVEEDQLPVKQVKRRTL